MNYFKRKYLEFNSYLIRQAKDRIQFALDTDVRAMIDSEITKQLNYARAESKSIFIIELESFAESRFFEEMCEEMVRQYDFRDLVKAEIKLLAYDVADENSDIVDAVEQHITSALDDVIEDMSDDIIDKLNDAINKKLCSVGPIETSLLINQVNL